MKRIAYVWIAGTILAGLTASFAGAQTAAPQEQPLGDYARTVRKDKKPATAKQFDNDNLPAQDKLSIVGNAAGSSPASDNSQAAASGQDADQSKAADKPPTVQPGESQEDRQKTYDAWKDRLADEKNKIDLLSREFDVEQREYKLRAAAMYADAGNRMRNSAAWDKEAAVPASEGEGAEAAARSGRNEAVSVRDSATAVSRATRDYKKIAALAAVFAVVVIAVLFWQFRRRPASPAGPANPTTVAVLPFQNLSSDKDTDFLRLALPDEIATSLSYVQSLSIRPFATTSKYNAASVDLQQAGREMRVTDIVTGHYLREGDQLQLTLEAVDVENNRTVWRDTLSVGALDMLAMRGQITAKVRQGLVPALGASTASGDSGTRPKNEEAYDLYLRSLSVPHDPGPNKQAIATLERAVAIDPAYAPAWGALGLRYYYDASYSNGGEELFRRSDAAYERALTLDPNLISAAAQLVANHVERGEMKKAYAEAEDLVKRRPESANAHFALSYVLRYAGLLDDSARECDAALTLDPGSYLLRSCALVFLELGKITRARDFIQLDTGSEWAAYVTLNAFLREGRMEQARASVQRVSTNPYYHRDFLEACLQSRPAPELDKIAHQMELAELADADSEPQYMRGAILIFCGQAKSGVRLLNSAIARNYCAYSALQSDPLLAKLRGTPEFSQLLSDAKECQKKFLAEHE